MLLLVGVCCLYSRCGFGFLDLLVIVVILVLIVVVLTGLLPQFLVFVLCLGSRCGIWFGTFGGWCFGC